MTLTARNRINRQHNTSIPVTHSNNKTTQDRQFFLDALMPVKTPLYNFIRKAMNFDPDADDVYQETLLKSFRYLNSFQRERSFKTWIFTIAHNLVKERFKVSAFTCSRFTPEQMEQVATGEPDSGFQQEVQEIYKAAGKLKPRQREIFFLYYYNEFTVKEIVKITGVSRANVKFILYQARNLIKKMVEVST